MKLYWKLFVAIWLASFLLSSLGIALGHLLGGRDHQPRPARHVVVSELRSVLGEQGLAGISQWESKTRYVRAGDVFIFSRHAELLYPDTIDDATLAGMKDILESKEKHRRRWNGDYFAFNARVDFQRARVVLKSPPPWQKELRKRLWLRFLLALVISGLVCFGLARLFTSRIKQLNQTVDEIAGGNLAARTATKQYMPDEIDTLSVNVNRMAVHIESLLGSQKQLLSDVSHELRSPLARMQLALAVYRQQNDPEMLTRIDDEIQRLDDMVGDLLLLPRLENEAAGADVINLASLLATLVDAESLSADQSHCQLQLDAPACECNVAGTGSLLRSVFENLLRNALRHAPVDSVVTVSLMRCGNDYRVTVADQGSGVAEELLRKIFEPFYRADDARSRDQGGVGLGLAIVSRAVALHGGKVEAHNGNPGLVCEVTLPAFDHE